MPLNIRCVAARLPRQRGGRTRHAGCIYSASLDRLREKTLDLRKSENGKKRPPGSNSSFAANPLNN